MDIVLNTVFNNPNLPVVPVPGFHDTFNRANGPVGSTPGGRPWVAHPSNASWVISDGALVLASAPPGNSLAVVNAEAANGTLTVAIGDVGPGSGRWGAVFRFRDLTNYHAIHSNGAGRYTFYTRVGGVVTAVAESAIASASNDVITVTMNGPQIVARVNGTTIFSGNEPTLTTETRHGVWRHDSASGLRFKEARYVPA